MNDKNVDYIDEYAEVQFDGSVKEGLAKKQQDKIIQKSKVQEQLEESMRAKVKYMYNPPAETLQHNLYPSIKKKHQINGEAHFALVKETLNKITKKDSHKQLEHGNRILTVDEIIEKLTSKHHSKLKGPRARMMTGGSKYDIPDVQKLRKILMSMSTMDRQKMIDELAHNEDSLAGIL